MHRRSTPLSSATALALRSQLLLRGLTWLDMMTVVLLETTLETMDAAGRVTTRLSAAGVAHHAGIRATVISCRCASALTVIELHWAASRPAGQPSSRCGCGGVGRVHAAVEVRGSSCWWDASWPGSVLPVRLDFGVEVRAVHAEGVGDAPASRCTVMSSDSGPSSDAAWCAGREGELVRPPRCRREDAHCARRPRRRSSAAQGSSLGDWRLTGSATGVCMRSARHAGSPHWVGGPTLRTLGLCVA